ncbi:NAD(P)-binding protein [Candidatus Falkowbacteria bacterium]|nr:NAD(P)-binding protein [Candidatus Falkowbacteria bacterium]
MKKKLAIVGSGISAMTCAYYLRDDYEISIFEKNDYLGGHTHTHLIKEGNNEFKIDSGFMVFNLNTYTNMLKMFSELGVEMQKTDMSFSVFNKKNGLQYSGGSLFDLFAQKKNIFSLRFWKFLFEINKFFKVAIKDYNKIAGSHESIRDYCKRYNLSDYFIDNYLAPMSSAVWSVPHRNIYDFPISLLLPFFYNHGLLTAGRQFQWFTVKGGSDTYTRKIVEKGNFDIHLNEAVDFVDENDNGAQLITKNNNYNFDYVILATHAPDSLEIFKNMPAEKKKLLEQFAYNNNKAVLHKDSTQMPTIKRVWASWNQIINVDGEKGSTIYWMNRLQRPLAKLDYLVSINPFEEIVNDKIIKKIDYEHPNFTVENFALQGRLAELNKQTKIFFAGAYFGYGFHEDGVKSGLGVVNILKTSK